MVGILYEKKFVPIAIGVFSHETVDVFQMVFEWIDNNATVSPTNLMADGDEGTRSAALFFSCAVGTRRKPVKST